MDRSYRAMSPRLFFLDNLRTFLIFMVILYHAGFVYTPSLEAWWPVVDPIRNDNIGLVGMYIDLFVMFGLFFVSGYFVPNSLRSRSAVEFVKAKFKRIMIPWLVAVLTLVPIYKYVFLYSRGLPQEEWYSYFHWFAREGADLNFANDPNQGWLWFLPILFLYQVLFLVIAKAKLWPINVSLKWAVILTFFIGLVYSMTLATLEFTGWTKTIIFDFQRERLLVYFMVFLLGALCSESGVFESGRLRPGYFIWSNIVLWIGLTVYTATALNFFFNMITPGRNFFFVSELVDGIAYFGSVLLSMLCFLHILVYTFRSWVNQKSPFLDILNGNSYNVYIIHMIVLAGLALMLVEVDLSPGIKYLVLAVLTFVVSNLLASGYYQVKKRIPDS